MQFKKIGECCDILDAHRIPIKAADRKKGPYPYYGANGVQDHVDDYIFDDDLVLLAEDGGNFGSKVRPIAYRVSGKCWVNNHAHVLKPKSGLDVDYLCYSLMFYDVTRIINGATRAKLTQSAMSQMRIPYVDLTHQKAIVNTLNKIQKIIENRKKEKGLLDKSIKARFVEMFGDPVINPNHYQVHQLKDFIENLTSGSRGWAKYCIDGGNEWFITIKNVKDSHILTDNMQPVNAPNNVEAKRTRVQEGDLLISITADLGRTGVVTKEIADHGAYINQHLTCIRLNREYVDPLFVSFFMESAAGKRQFAAKNQNAVKAGLNFTAIESLKLFVPPFSEQRKFVLFAEQVDKSKAAIQKSIDETQLLYDSLMQKYFG